MNRQCLPTSRKSIPVLVQSSNSTKKVNRGINTPDEFTFCPKCRERAAVECLDDVQLLREYTKSMNYINSCHGIINEMITARQVHTTYTMPDLPNFMNIFTMLNKKVLPDLDNIGTLEQIYSRIEGCCEKSEKINPESDLETDKSLEHPKTPDSERTRKQRPRTSSIPRKIKTPERTFVEEERSESPKRRNRNIKVEINVNRDNEEISTVCDGLNLSQKDLDKFAQELLGSCSDNSPDVSPRTVSSLSRSPSPVKLRKNTQKISYKTRSEHSIKVPPAKVKQKPSLVKNSSKSLKSRTISICEPSTKKEPKRIRSPPLSPKKGSYANAYTKRAAGKRDEADDNRKVKSQPILKSSRQQHWGQNSDTILTQQQLEKFEDSDIEPDENDFGLVAVRNSISVKKQKQKNTMQGLNFSQPDSKYVVKEKPNDFFTKRRQTSSGLIEGKRSDSEIDTDKDINDYISESDIDDDIFENIEKPKTKKRVPKSVLSSIGILNNNGKITPEKELELEKLKSIRAQDKQNISFRQPRNRDTEGTYEEVVKMSTTRCSSRSSDIKTDDEEREREIRTHCMEATAQHQKQESMSYRCRH